MSFDPITLDEVRRQAEATRADLAALSAVVQSLSVSKKVQRGVVTPTSMAEVVVTVSAIDVNKAFMTLLTNGHNSAFDRGLQNMISARVINSTSIGIKGFSIVESQSNIYHPVSWELVEFK
jgi:hypothetical protein